MTHRYTLDGKLQFEVIRLREHVRAQYGGTKTFPRHVGPGGRWYFGQGKWKGRKDKPLYYQDEALAALRSGGTIYIAEGERDVDSIRSADCIAVCNPDGAGCFHKHHARTLVAALTHGDDHPEPDVAAVFQSTITIVSDNDEAGHRHARKVYSMLTEDPDLQRRVKVISPPEGCKDLSEFLSQEMANDDPKLALQMLNDSQSDEQLDLAPVEFEPLAAVQERELLPFPVDAMGAAANYVRALAAHTQTPIDLPGAITLGFMGAAVARKAIVRATHDEELSLYVAVLMDPGSRKSVVFKASSKPLIDSEEDLGVAAAPVVARNIEKVDLLRKRMAKLKQKYAKEEDETERAAIEETVMSLRVELLEAEGKQMNLPRLIVGDVTPEKLAILTSENQERMVLASGEGGEIFDRLDRYSGNGEPNLDLILKGHDGERCSVDRVSAPPVKMKRPVLTIVTTIQPYVLEKLAKTGAFMGRGLVHRFAWVFPRDPRGHRDARNSVPMDADTTREYEAMMKGLIAVQHIFESPLVISVDGEALEIYLEFAQRVETNMANDGKFEFIKNWAGKLPGKALRIAGILTLADDPSRSEIKPAIMMSAIELAEYFADHALRAFEVLEGRTGDRQLDKLWSWITNRTDNPARDFSRSEAWDGVKNGIFRTAADLNGALARLAAHGRIAQRDVQKPKSGRPPQVWAVNPKAIHDK